MQPITLLTSAMNGCNSLETKIGNLYIFALASFNNQEVQTCPYNESEGGSGRKSDDEEPQDLFREKVPGENYSEVDDVHGGILYNLPCAS